jgi:glycosyltransferase involved in cell wall biosynthesis
MKVSVVIPTYYRSHDLSELFDSLLKQTVKPFEVIVVDDTPLNTIKKLCKKYEVRFEEIDSSLSYIKNPRERSAAIARNVGVENAEGEIILFLDSDTILYEDYIEKILEVFKGRPNAVGVTGWIVRTENQRLFWLRFFVDQLIRRPFLLGKRVKDGYKIFEYPLVLTEIKNCQCLSGCNMSFKKNILNEFRFDENLKGYSYMEDLLISYSIFKRYPNGLYITPHAKCIHKVSEEGKIKNHVLKSHLDSCRKYVLMKIFGRKGLLIYYWQTLGIMILTLKRMLRNLLGLS